MRKLLVPLSAAMFALASVALPVHAADAAKAEAKAMDKKADADYKAAKDACKAMKGDEQKRCMADAKAQHEKTEADAKAMKKKS
jgi:hypothetical protein